MKNCILFFIYSFLFFQMYAQNLPVKRIDDRGGLGTGTTTWYADTIYLLDRMVFVNPGDKLTIEAGTIIKGAIGTGNMTSGLVIARGAAIDAQGTATEPIIFTSEVDDVDDLTDLPVISQGLWGGMIVLGNACINEGIGESLIEGFSSQETRAYFGASDTDRDGIIDIACDDGDNSGVMSYISIRYAGSQFNAGHELNGLTLAGVGSATQIDHIEAISGQDDGFEFFGGTVNTKYMMSVNNGDDAYDYDLGYRGKGQFWLAVQSKEANPNRGGEHDGGTNPEDASPFSVPTIYNVTYVGADPNGFERQRLISFRDNAGGNYYNSIFVNYGRGVDIEWRLDSVQTSFDRLIQGDLNMDCNIFWNVAGNDAAKLFDIRPIAFSSDSLKPDSLTAVIAARTNLQSIIAQTNNQVINPQFVNIDPAQGVIDLTLDPNSPALNNVCSYPPLDSFFCQVSYAGAMEVKSAARKSWVEEWTFMDRVGRNTTGIFDWGQVTPPSLMVYPNPASDFLYVGLPEGTSNAPFLAEIFDLNGRKIASQAINGLAEKLEISVSNLAKGSYILQIRQESVIGISRFNMR